MFSDCFSELFVLSLLSIVALLTACYKKFFKIPPHKRKFAVTFWQLLASFAVFLIPWSLIGFFFGKALYGGVLAFSVSAAIFIWFLRRCPKETSRDILVPFSHETSRYSLGALTWLIAFPTSQFTAKLIHCLLGLPTLPEQSIIKQIEALKPYPFLFTLMVIVIVLLIPVIEEFLFRGFLYTFLKNKLPRYAASLITALLFTAAHYGASEGLGNVEILGALFVLALFLNHVYEKGGNILAPIALHQTFNCISLAMLLFL